MATYHVQTKVKPNTSSNEGYQIEALGPNLSVEAESHIACEFAKESIAFASESGSICDILGKAAPLFQLRPLWISDTHKFRLPSLIEVDLPASIQVLGEDLSALQDSVTHFASSVLRLGFNTVIFSQASANKNAANCRLSWKAWQVVLDTIRARG